MRRTLLVLFVVLLALPAVAADKPTRGLRYPSLTPDGKSVVFGYRGDIWIAPLDGKGQAQRLTIHEVQDTVPRVSPDGKQVVFTSKRNGAYDLFVMPIEGGMPEQITFHSAVEIVCDWSPDGKRILFMSNRDAGPGGLDLYEVGLDGGTPRRITRDGAREGSYSKDGKQIVYVRGTNTIYWDNYKGSGNYDIYTVETKGGLPRRLTDTEGNERYPFFSADAKTIFFLAEEKGVANFHSMPALGGKRTQVTKYTGSDVHRPDLNWDHKTAVFERVGRLYRTDLAAPAAQPTSIPISIKSDVRNSGIEVRTITSGGEQVHLSRDGRQATLSLRGDIWVMAASGGNAKRVTSGPAKDEWSRFSPDGRSIAYINRQRGNSDIYLLDLASGKSRPLTKHQANDFFQNWSPDGSKLVFCSERSGNRDIWELELASGQVRQLTDDPAGDDDPSYSPDGKLIAFDSARDGSQAIYVMDADGANVRRVTQGTGFLQVPSFSPDGQLLVYEGFQPTTGKSGGLYVISVRGGPSMQISRTGQTACWSPLGDYIYFTRQGPQGGVFRVRAPESIMAGERVPFVARVEVDRRKELAVLFDEAWTALGQGFYDPGMHKVNWKDMRTKYRDMAVDAENKDEFHNIIRQMLAELGASHLGIGGGQPGGNSAVPKTRESGYLGLEFEPAPVEGGALKVAGVLAGGPADKVGVRVGDVVTRIGRRKLKPGTNLDKILAGTAGKGLRLTFKPRSEAGLGNERAETVQPVVWSELRKLRYADWVATRGRRVKKATRTKKGEVAYIHLNAMDPGNLRKFQQAVTRWNRSRKIKGMILDVRNNGGGNIHNQLIAILSAKPLARVQRRGGPKMVQPALYWNRPVVVLINERSYSDAEVFPFMFKAAGLGKVVGVPTAGGVIGTNNITLSDGSSFRVPRTGFWGMDGTNLEGLGVKPDHLVEETAEDRLTGRDPQLEKAIEVVSAEIAGKKTAPKPKPEAKPEEKPEVKPEPKPAPKPAPKPEVKPEPNPKPVTLAGALHPLADVEVGEWVRYRGLAADGSETIVKATVTSVAGGVVTLQKEIEKGAGIPELPARMRQVVLLEVLKSFGEVSGHSVVRGKVKDAEAEIVIARLTMPNGETVVLSFTNHIPAYGLWKVEANKQVVVEAIEWGTPEPAVKQEKKSDVPADPMYDAKEGEWLRFKVTTAGGQELELTLAVVEATEDEVVLQQTIAAGERKMRGPQMRRERRKTLAAPRSRELNDTARETITVGEKTFACVRLTTTDPKGIQERWWYCAEIPVNGLVRKERDGVVVMELVEWGDEAEEDDG